MPELKAFVQSRGLCIAQTGFTTNTKNNSHGEILRNFVLNHPNCTHYLFLDADICFLEDNTIGVLLQELEERDNAFGIGPRMSWDGIEEIPLDARKDNPDI